MQGKDSRKTELKKTLTRVQRAIPERKENLES
jgi:hypothetical protein